MRWHRIGRQKAGWRAYVWQWAYPVSAGAAKLIILFACFLPGPFAIDRPMHATHSTLDGSATSKIMTPAATHSDLTDMGLKTPIAALESFSRALHWQPLQQPNNGPLIEDIAACFAASVRLLKHPDLADKKAEALKSLTTIFQFATNLPAKHMSKIFTPANFNLLAQTCGREVTAKPLLDLFIHCNPHLTFHNGPKAPILA